MNRNDSEVHREFGILQVSKFEVVLGVFDYDTMLGIGSGTSSVQTLKFYAVLHELNFDRNVWLFSVLSSMD